MPIPDEYRNVWRLLTGSQRDIHQQWRESGRDGEYIARIGNYSVTISINRLTEMFGASMRISSPVSIQLLLPEGLEIGRFDVRPEDSDYGDVRAFYDRVAKGATKKADMLKEIEQQLRNAG